MPSRRSWRLRRGSRLSFGWLLVLAVLACSCKPAKTKEEIEQEKLMAMWLDNVPQLKPLNPTNAEIVELTKTHEAGLTDPSAVELIQLSRDRRVPFTDGQSVADLLNASVAEPTVMELAHLNQLGPWAGEAQAMRLAGLTDKIILAVAQRRSRNLPVLSGKRLGELKNAGATEAKILAMVEDGATDEAAAKFIAKSAAAAGGHSFVSQKRARKR